MNKQALVDATIKSGGKQSALAEADDLWNRLNFLQETGRYGQLLSSLAKANDKSNFLALVLEANFAFQFESHDLALVYEVQQDEQKGSSIDFLREMQSGDRVYFELRLVQQTQSILDSINAQLVRWGIYSLLMSGDDEKKEIVRLQNTILGKVQDKNGKPIKFFSAEANAVNIVVVDASESVLGAIDVQDCMLATYGDPGVEEVYRRQVFGLFQDDRPEYPQYIHNLAAKYSHIRATLHGVLFLFKKRNTGLLAYRLEQYLFWNRALMDEARAQAILDELGTAIPVFHNQ